MELGGKKKEAWESKQQPTQMRWRRAKCGDAVAHIVWCLALPLLIHRQTDSSGGVYSIFFLVAFSYVYFFPFHQIFHQHVEDIYGQRTRVRRRRRRRRAVLPSYDSSGGGTASQKRQQTKTGLHAFRHIQTQAHISEQRKNKIRQSTSLTSEKRSTVQRRVSSGRG